MWPFCKKEPVKKWGEWRSLNKCNKCGRLQEPFCFDFNQGVCPVCGSDDIDIVVARWEESNRRNGFVCERILHRSEIKV